MPLVRNSVGTWLLIVALIGLCLAPLANLSDLTYVTLVYLKFALVILATFLARYRQGRPAAWWFGFATFGWASILIGGPGNSDRSVAVSSSIDLAELSGSLAEFLLDLLFPFKPRNHARLNSFFQMRGVVQFWFLILAAVTGGFLSLFVYNRQNRRPADIDSTESVDPLNLR